METILTRITDYLLTQSWQIAVLVVVIGAINFTLRKRSAHIRYLLWLIVLAKCLVPPLLTVPLAVLPQEEPTVALEAVSVNISEYFEQPSIPIETPPIPMPIVRDRPTKINIYEWLGAGWMVGAIAFLVFNLLKALRANLWLWRQRKALPVELQNYIEKLFSTNGISTFPSVWLVDGFGQPFVWGLLRGSIYLPANFGNIRKPEHRRSVLEHELSHILRFDAAINLLQVIAQAIFWFHPFVWWANRKIRAEREKCCDETAIARLNAVPKDYGTAIVETLAARNESARPVPSLAVAGPVKNIEERIKIMLRPGKKFYKSPSLIAATVVLLLALLTVPTALVLTARAETNVKALPLHQAAADGNINNVKSLISKGADVNALQGESRWTPLHSAASQGHAHVAEVLIANGADIDARNARGLTPLHEAVWRGRMNVVEILIAKGADVNAKGGAAQTPLHMAAGRGHKDLAELLIAKGADVNAKNKWGEMPLHRAVLEGRRHVAELLIAMGADVNAKNRNGETPVHLAMERNRKEIVELVVAKGANVSAIHLAAYMGDLVKIRSLMKEGANANVKDEYGDTPLHYAVAGGQKGIAELLIAKGADINAKDEKGRTPLHHAAAHGHKDVAEFLINKGASLEVTTQNQWGLTPLHTAAESDQKDMVQLLIAKGADMHGRWTALHFAAWGGATTVAQFLIDQGADVNARAGAGLTPLHRAAQAGHISVAELLLAKGADVNAKDIANGCSALCWAAYCGQYQMAEFLLNRGADIEAKDIGGNTPLHSAVDNHQPEIVDLLLAQGAEFSPIHMAAYSGDLVKVKALLAKGTDLDAKEGSFTPLHFAACGGQTDVAEFLISKGADVNAKDSIDATPLHYAGQNGHKNTVELLVAKGSDVNARDNDGSTPLHYTTSWRYHRDIAEFLIAKGANVDARDNQGWSALQRAQRAGHKDIVELLRKHGAK